tara:strand:+ start:1052 stop:1474 length:423 start_codon:yes stop_codon:yes gene_type:complete
MAATDLNTVRSTIEARLSTELASSPAIPVVFSNQPFDATSNESFVQCEISFGSGETTSQGNQTSANTLIVGLLTLNVFTEQGIGSGGNFTICKRLRDLYNRITVSDVIFDAVVGPEILSQPPEGKFVTQLRITFETYEEL